MFCLKPKSLLNLRISNGYPMRKIKSIPKNKLTFENILWCAERKVTKFGNSAKVGCSKEYIGKTAYVVVINES